MDQVNWVIEDRPPTFPGVVSQFCTQAQFETECFRAWCAELKHPVIYHRKLWEWCYILQALNEACMIAPSRRGLGFGIGQEPITAVLARHGCDLVATDYDPEQAAQDGWVESGQHARAPQDLNVRDICPKEAFESRVTFRTADMRKIPAELTGFDLIWSSCALEHLGTLRLGLDFVLNSLHCLRPNGIAVHTTEYNVFSNDATVAEGGTVIYRRRDIEDLAHELRANGHSITLNFTMDVQPLDRVFDLPPYGGNPHLKIAVGGFVTTSIGLIIQKCG